MLPNHDQFIKAIQDRKKVCVQFFSRPDNAVLDRVCAPVDYGPGTGPADGLNRYVFLNYTDKTGAPLLSLVPQQITALQVLGDTFDPSAIPSPVTPWSVPREWGCAAPDDKQIASIVASTDISAIKASTPSAPSAPATAPAVTSGT